MLKIQSNSRQIPKQKNVCSNKKYYDVLYAYFQCISEQDEATGERYFYKKDVKFTHLGRVFDLTRQTMATKFKNLIELGLIIDENKDIYRLPKLEDNVAALVPYDTLKVITDTLNEKTISAYVYFLNRYYANQCKAFTFTLDQVKSFVGLSTTTRHNNDTITNILLILQKIGLIKFSKASVVEKGEEITIKTQYTIDWVTNTLQF